MDESKIIAWIDGELSPEEAAEIEAAVAGDPKLAALAARHRRIRARFASTIEPLLADPEAKPRRARVVSLTAPHEDRSRQVDPSTQHPRRRWLGPSLAFAAVGLVAGWIAGQAMAPHAIADRASALTLSAPVAQALDHQASGELGTVNVALSFKDHDGHFCRSFVAQYIGGVACKMPDGWELRYAALVDAQRGDYRLAGSDPASAKVVATMIAGTPFDAEDERKAISAGWR